MTMRVVWIPVNTAIALTLLGSIGHYLTDAFTVERRDRLSPLMVSSRTNKCMVGGMGWDNGSYLDNLGGSDQDRDEEKEAYEDFKASRESFQQRQSERMNSDAGRKFLQERMLNRPEQSDADWMDAQDDPKLSRFQHMMEQSKKKANPQQLRGPPGFVQKLAVPLDDDDDEESDSEEE